MTSILSSERQFASKVDRWLLAAGLVPVIAALGVLMGVIAGELPAWLLLLVVAPPAFIAWTFMSTFYVVDADTLRVRSGPFRWTVRLDAIRTLTATHNPLSAPALSLDRIAVAHAGGTLLVSPKDKPGFVAAILAANPAVGTTGLPRPSGTGSGDEVPPTRARSLLILLPGVIIGVAAVVLATTLIYAGTRPPTVRIGPRAIEISGLASSVVAKTEVVRIELADALPRPTNRSGFSALGELRGDFDIAGLGRARVYISRDVPPYIIIHTTTQPVVVNFADPARTRVLYDELRRAWQIPGDDR